MPLLPAAIGIILNHNQTEVLLIKRRDVPLWVLPGGGIEPNETTQAALLREIEEETGLHVQIIRKCAEYSPMNRLAAFTSVFICHIQSGKIGLSDETADIAFYPIQKLPLSLFSPHALWLQEGLSHSTIVRRSLTEISYKTLFKYFVTHPWQVLRFAWTRLTRK